MAGLSITGQMKVSTLQDGFLKEFGLTLRIYDGRSFADPTQTLAQVRKKKGSGKALSVAKNMKVGNLEDKFEEEFGLKVQVAGSDDSYLCDNDLTLNGAQQEDEKKLGRKAKKAARQDVANDEDEDINSAGSGSDEGQVFKVFGLKELMLYETVIEEKRLIEMDAVELKTMIDDKLLNESFQVFLINRDEFELSGERKIEVSIKFNERDHMPQIEPGHIRLVFWEELADANVQVQIPAGIDDLRLVVDGNTFGCMDDWGNETFTEYSLVSKEKELDIYFESESFGEQADKVVYLIKSDSESESIRDLDSNTDFADEFSEALEELGLNENVSGDPQKKPGSSDEGDTYLINYNDPSAACSIFWESEDYSIDEVEPYISAIQCDDEDEFLELYSAESPESDGSGGFRTKELSGFRFVKAEEENEYFLCFNAVIELHLSENPEFAEGLEKANNKVIARLGFKKDGKPILDEDGFEEIFYFMSEDRSVELQTAD